jgi:hypothetical protein
MVGYTAFYIPMNKGIEKRLEATEMWFWRRMLKVPWTDKITNENILKQINEKRQSKN